MLCITSSQLSSFATTNNAQSYPASHLSNFTEADGPQSIPASPMSRFTTANNAQHNSASHLSMAAHGNKDLNCANSIRASQMSTADCNRPHLEFPSPSNSNTPSHCHGNPQWRGSGDLRKHGAKNLIVLRGDMMRPHPPQRLSSLPCTSSPATPQLKRYSCPPMGLSGLALPTMMTATSSPPTVQTSVITGPSPLGWKMRPKSSSSSSGARIARLSLNLTYASDATANANANTAATAKATASASASANASAIASPCHEPPSNSSPTPKSPSVPPPKPHRRCHSDTSALIRSREIPWPVVTHEQLRAVHLRPVCFDESDAVSGEGEEEEQEAGRTKVVPQGGKVPPPVAAKPASERWQAYVTARPLPPPIRAPASSAANQERAIYSVVMKPKHELAGQSDDHIHDATPTHNGCQQSHLNDTSPCQSEMSCRSQSNHHPIKTQVVKQVEKEGKRRSLPPLLPADCKSQRGGLPVGDRTKKNTSLSWMKRLSLGHY